MSDTEETIPPEPVAEKPKRKRRTYKRRAKPQAAARPQVPNEFVGMTVTACPAACMTDGRCVISTVNVCKHPYKAPDSGCGPVTMANRDRAWKFLKHQKIEAA